MPNLRTCLKLLDTYGISFASYAAVGLASALVEWSVFYALSLRGHVFVAAAVAFLVATLANHGLSKGLIFTSTRSAPVEFGLVLVVSGLAFTVNLAAFGVLQWACGWSPLAAKIAGTGFGFIANFGLRQFYIFSADTRFLTLSRAARGLRTRAARQREQFDPR